MKRKHTTDCDELKQPNKKKTKLTDCREEQTQELYGSMGAAPLSSEVDDFDELKKTCKVRKSTNSKNKKLSVKELKSKTKQKTVAGTFGSLSDEIILMIFKNLDQQTLLQCALVCKRWRNIAFDTDLWTRIDVSHRKLLPRNMELILQRNPYLLRMAQTEITDFPLFDQPNILKHKTYKLEYLDLSMAVIKPEDLASFLSGCRHLIKLSLENCTINDNVCKGIANNCNLQVLNMSMCSGITKSGMGTILKFCKKLEELNLAWTHLDMDTISHISETLNNTIKKVNLSGCLKEMTDSHIDSLLSRCTEITDLDLSDCSSITEEHIEQITEKLKNLKQLSLSRCYSIRTTAYYNILLAPSSLSSLNIFGLFDTKNIEVFQQTNPSIGINKHFYSTIARPTIGIRRTSIWGLSMTDK